MPLFDQMIVIPDPECVSTLTALLDSQLRPSRAFILVLSGRGRLADRQRQILARSGIESELILVSEPWSEAAITALLQQLTSRLPTGERIGVNLSGMALPLHYHLYQLAQQQQWRVFMVHPLSDRLIWLNQQQQRAAVAIEDRLTLKDYFAVKGCRMEVAQAQDRSLSVTFEQLQPLLDEYDTIAPLLTQLNWAASSAGSALLSPSLSQLSSKQWYDFCQLLQPFQDLGLVTIKGKQLCFRDAESVNFMKGEWFEWLVEDLIEQVRARYPIQDWARGVEITRLSPEGDPIRNELDVVFLINNQLFIIECKTVKFENALPRVDTIYKLDSLIELLGGVNGQAMLASYLPLTESIQNRAVDLNILFVSGKSLLNLPKRIERWILQRSMTTH